jgi:hypothetical protein
VLGAKNNARINLKIIEPEGREGREPKEVKEIKSTEPAEEKATKVV